MVIPKRNADDTDLLRLKKIKMKTYLSCFFDDRDKNPI